MLSRRAVYRPGVDLPVTQIRPHPHSGEGRVHRASLAGAVRMYCRRGECRRALLSPGDPPSPGYGCTADAQNRLRTSRASTSRLGPLGIRVRHVADTPTPRTAGGTIG